MTTDTNPYDEVCDGPVYEDDEEPAEEDCSAFAEDER